MKTVCVQKFTSIEQNAVSQKFSFAFVIKFGVDYASNCPICSNKKVIDYSRDSHG